MENKPHKINSVSSAMMVIVALILDLISIIPFVNIVSTFLAGMIFTAWFWLLGFGIINSKRVSTMVITALGEFIPVISAAPFITIGVVAVIIMQNNPLAANVGALATQKKSTPASTPIKQPKQTPPPLPDRAASNGGGLEVSKKTQAQKTTPAQTIEPGAKQTNIVTFPRRTMTDINPPVPFTDEDEENLAA